MKKIYLFILLAIIALTIPYPASAAIQASITRNVVEQRALSMINFTWTYSSQNNANIDSKYAYAVTPPIQINNTAKQMKGIPYCWGGFDSPYTASYNQPWSNFGDAVSQGAYTGNINSDGGIGYVPGTAGLDCSGFIQAAFNIKDVKQNSYDLMKNYFTPISQGELKRMDILGIAGVHLVIFDSWGTFNGLEGAYTYESTSDTYHGGIQGAKRYFLSMNTINKGYTAARYKYIQEEAPLPYPVSTGIFAKVTDNLNLRIAASTTASIIEVIPRDSIIYVNSYSSGWYQISYNGKFGWVWGQYISSIPSGTYVTVKNTTLLNIRTQPNITAPIVGTLSTYQYAQVLNYSSDRKWMQIKINNVTGWSSAAYLSYIY